jgi:hypothetical protein
MSRLNLNLHQHFVRASKLPRRNFRLLTREPLSSELSFLLSVIACLGGLSLLYLLF